MFLWIVFALLTAAVAAALLLPFARSSAESPNHVGDVEVYRDQLKEIDRDLDQGLIGSEEADYARAEVGRRLLAAAGSGKAGEGSSTPRPVRRHRAAIALVTIAPPAIGLCLYIILGQPGLPDQPLEARLANPGNNMALLVAKAERHLAQNPNDGAGWDLLGPIYVRMQRFGDAELAYRNALRINGESAARYAGLGEALVAMSDGVITEDARQSFEAAVKLDPKDPRPRFYVALGLEQSGKTAEARAAFEEIARTSPADAPWMPLVNQHIAKAGGTPETAPAAADGAGRAPGGPSEADVAAANDLSAGDRQQMIRGMVDSLAARLKQEPDNIEGWLRIIRSYSVLGDRASAEDALRVGLDQFAADSGKASQLKALAGEIGLPLPVNAQGAQQ